MVVATLEVVYEEVVTFGLDATTPERAVAAPYQNHVCSSFHLHRSY